MPSARKPCAVALAWISARMSGPAKKKKVGVESVARGQQRQFLPGKRLFYKHILTIAYSWSVPDQLDETSPST
jgi:hypothetical protein